MAKRFLIAFVTFIGLIIPLALLLAMLAAPARPAAMERPGCAPLAAQTFTSGAMLPVK
ncbi:MAG TPA: hypothetical protein VEF90_04315 [Xanthobacteraceae bacterium]|nr:hypothetical protein [Xanthobacteraceae bacterium]